jgi:hypothetical protein
MADDDGGDALDAEDEFERARDADHLRLVATLLAVYAPFMLVVLLGGAPWRHGGESLGAFLFAARSVFASLAPGPLAWLLVERRSRTLCVVAAFLIAWDWPAGTIVGVAALLVLARPSVADAFADAKDARRPASTLDEAARRMLARSATRRRRRAATPTGAPDTDA